MSNPILQDLEYILQAAKNKDTVSNAYETGFLMGRMAADRWVSVDKELPEKNGLYFVHEYKDKGVYISYFINGDWPPHHNVKYWQLLPTPPRSEVGKD